MASILTIPSVGVHKNQPVGKSALSTSCTPLNMNAPDFADDLKFSTRLDSTPELRYPPDSIMLMIANFSEEELTFPKGTILRVA